MRRVYGQSAKCTACGQQARVQQLLARALQEVTNGALGDAILEVSVYATEGELLALFVACLLECIVGKLTVVKVVMLIFFPGLAAKVLKAHLAATVSTDESST